MAIGSGHVTGTVSTTVETAHVSRAVMGDLLLICILYTDTETWWQMYLKYRYWNCYFQIEMH